VLFHTGNLQQFYSRALQFEQWQTDAQLLSETVRLGCDRLLEKNTARRRYGFVAVLRHPETLQSYRSNSTAISSW